MMTSKDLLRFLRQAKEARRKALQRWNRQVVNGYRISCRPGCDWCCYQIVAAGLWEGALLANYLIQTKQNKLLEAVMRQGEEQAELYTELSHTEAADVWFVKQEPCAFLQDHRCAVYALRPTACAAHCVVSPAADCAPPTGKMVAGLDSEEPTVTSLLIDADLLRLMFGEDQAVAQPQPLGRVVALGAQLLLKGPGAIASFEVAHP